MYRTILIGYDDSDHAKDALALGKTLADERGELTLAGVFPWHPWLPADAPPSPPEVELARAIERAASEHGTRADAFPSSSPARGLHDLAEEMEADLIVVGSSHRGAIGRVLAGSVARGLLHGAPCAIAVAPSGYRDAQRELRTIGVGIDGSPESQLALEAAVELAQARGATLRPIAVVDASASSAWGYPELQNAVREHLGRLLVDTSTHVPDGLAVESRLVEGAPGLSLAREAEALDLLCVGSRGYGPLRRVLLGSVSGQLVESASCPVLVTPRPATVEPSD
jgi:nucleotide-binding universal stress UspA family protein